MIFKVSMPKILSDDTGVNDHDLLYTEATDEPASEALGPAFPSSYPQTGPTISDKTQNQDQYLKPRVSRTNDQGLQLLK